jgi:hypothetical protein
MADRKISDLTALTTPASGDFLPIVDISEAAAATKNKRITIQSLFQGIPVNVGIGTSSPGELLELAATTDPKIRFVDVGNVEAKIGISSSTALTFEFNGTERLRIDSSGRVGIGTSSPSQKLHVSGVDTTNVGFNGVTKGVRFDFDATGSTIYGVDNSFFASYQPLRIGGSITQLMYGGTEGLRIDSSGRVGIGTTSPTALLELSGSGIVFKANTTTTTFTSTSIQIGGLTTTSNSGCFLKSYTNLGSTINSSLAFEVNGGATEAARIDSSGRVGIGTTGPTTLLDVNADTVRVRTARTPASATATGATGEICWDANYVYVCTATNTWKRSAISTW